MWFERLIHPQTTTTFLKETRGINWLRSIGSPDRFDRLFPMSQFEQWLSETRWDPERIYLIKNAQRYPSSMYLFSPELPRGWRPIGAVVQRLMQEGATLVANAVDESLGEVAKLAEEFEAVFDVSVGVNVYATRGDQQAFDAHWDEHDVFVVQVRGSKNWCVWKPTSLHPVPEVSALVPPPREEV